MVASSQRRVCSGLYSGPGMCRSTCLRNTLAAIRTSTGLSTDHTGSRSGLASPRAVNVSPCVALILTSPSKMVAPVGPSSVSTRAT